jgi:hypothetical protein
VAKQFRHSRPCPLPDILREVGPPFFVADSHRVPEALENLLAARTVPQVPLDRPPILSGEFVVEVARQAFEELDALVVVAQAWTIHDGPNSSRSSRRAR